MKKELTSKYNETTAALDYGPLTASIFICLLIGFPLAYVGQIFQLIADFLFGMIGIIFDVHSKLFSSFENSWFYAEFWVRYIYWVAFSLCFAMWLGVQYKKGWYRGHTSVIPICEIITTMIYIIVSLIFFNLFVSSIFGPLMILLSLTSSLKR